MSWSLLEAAWRVESLSGTEKLVLVRLADRASDEGLCYPGQTSLAKDCCLTPRTVRDALSSLLRAGHIVVENRASFTAPATYRITPKAPEGASGGGECSGAEAPSDHSGSSFRSPPENASGPLRKELPPNHHITIIEPSFNHKSGSIAPKSKRRSPVHGFDSFWATYPKKQGKVDAEKAWLHVTEADVPHITTALAWQTKTLEWTKAHGKFVPMPATYLRGQRWKDEKPAMSNGAVGYEGWKA